MTTVNTAEDLDLIDNTQSVTLSLIRTDGTNSVSIPNALKGDLSKDLSSQFNLEGNGSSWLIKAAELNPSSNGGEIQVDDEITSGTEVHVVLSAQLKANDGYWHCVTNRKK